jgi:two-component system OmpR family sensor kinase
MTRWAGLPIRGRLTVSFAAAAAVLITSLSVFVYARMGSDLLSTVDAGLSSRAELLASDLQHRGPALADVEPTLIESDEVFAQIAGPSGRVLQSSSIISRQRLLPAAEVRAVGGTGRAEFVNRSLTGIDSVARVLAVPVTTTRGRFVVLVGASLQDREDELVALAATLAIAGAIAVGLISLGAWLAVTAALRPVDRMRRQAAEISVRHPGRRLSVPGGGNELALLGGTLNRMLERIEDSVSRERQLVDRASHELRTPLAVQRIDLDLALSGPQSVQELQAALRSVSQENHHLTRLTEDLLVLARARGGMLPVRRAETSLAELLEAARRQVQPGSGAHARVSYWAADARVQVDPVWFRQAIGNLVDNAIQHTPPAGQVTVRAESRNGTLLVTVEDTGPGFPDTLLDGAFEPFVRPALAGGARRESVGLGLAVVRTIAEAHGGWVRAENLPDGGARVTLACGQGDGQDQR